MKYAKIKIPGLTTGISNCNVVLRIVGHRDYTQGTLTEHADGGLTSPWLEEKAKIVESFIHGLIQEEIKALAPVHEEATALTHQLRHLSGIGSLPTASDECTARQTAANKAQIAKIHHSLAELRGKIEMMHLSMKQMMNLCAACYKAKAFAYWRGVVKASNEPLPAEPAAKPGFPELEAIYQPTMELLTVE